MRQGKCLKKKNGSVVCAWMIFQPTKILSEMELMNVHQVFIGKRFTGMDQPLSITLTREKRRKRMNKQRGNIGAHTPVGKSVLFPNKKRYIAITGGDCLSCAFAGNDKAAKFCTFAACVKYLRKDNKEVTFIPAIEEKEEKND